MNPFGDDPLDSGWDIEWQSWPFGEERPVLWASGRVQSDKSYFDQIATWYPDFVFRVCDDQPKYVRESEHGTMVWPKPLPSEQQSLPKG